MPLVNMSDMLQHAYHHGYAVGAFGVVGWDILEGVVSAAETMRAPIILSVSYPGTDSIVSLARGVIEMGQRATIPVAFQVEVDDDFQAAAAAIDMGCDGLVFNASSHQLPDNVKLTQKVVALAAPRGVLVVGQVGQLENGAVNDGGEATHSGATSALEAKYYVEHTGVNCLAVSVSRIGNSVGGNKYDFTRLSKINQAVNIPLGIHGSAGFTDDQFRRMIGFGAAKINYSSVLLDVAARRIRENALAGVQGYAATMDGVRDTVRLEVERCIKVWGGGGRAAEVLMQCRLRDSASSKPAGDTGSREADSKAGKMKFTTGSPV